MTSSSTHSSERDEYNPPMLSPPLQRHHESIVPVLEYQPSNSNVVHNPPTRVSISLHPPVKQRRASSLASTSLCKKPFFILSIFIVLGIFAAITWYVIIRTTKNGRPDSCDSVPPSKRMVMFWQSEEKDCEKIPKGVTHVIWGFAEVKKGTSSINNKFQGNKQTLIQCIKKLKERCIYSIGSIGGAHNTEILAKVKNSDEFASSAVSLLEEYDLDGLDIDDETVGLEFNKQQVIDNVRAVREKIDLKKKGKYILTFDTLVFEADDNICKDAKKSAYSRCFPEEIVQYVDWINLMAYNVAKEPSIANSMYKSLLSTNFPLWIDKLQKDSKKLAIGVCVGNGCAYGPGPDESVIQQWTEYSKTAGGMMIYSGSADKKTKFAVSKKIINILQQ